MIKTVKQDVFSEKARGGAPAHLNLLPAKHKIHFSVVNLCQGQGPESLNAKGILERRCDPWDPRRPKVPLAERTSPEPESHRVHLGMVRMVSIVFWERDKLEKELWKGRNWQVRGISGCQDGDRAQCSWDSINGVP